VGRNRKEEDSVKSATQLYIAITKQPAEFRWRVSPEMMVDHIVFAPEKAKSGRSNKQHSARARHPPHFARCRCVIVDMFNHVECTSKIKGLIAPWQIQYRALYNVYARASTSEATTIRIIF